MILPRIKLGLVNSAMRDAQNISAEDNQKAFRTILEKAKSQDTKVLQNTGLRPDAAVYRDFPAEGFGGKDHIILGSSKNSIIAAHELGHSRHLHKRGGGNLISRAAHQIYTRTGVPSAGAAIVGSAVAGALSGYKAGNKEENTGEKEHISHKVMIPAAPAVILSSPSLISEASASREGYRIIKGAGVSKNTLKSARKVYRKAYGTYLLTPAISLGVGYGSHAIGKYISKKKNTRNEPK